MNYKINAQGVITHTSSSKELIGSKIKPKLTTMDWVIINRPTHSRDPKYGIYGSDNGNNEAIVYTLYDKEYLDYKNITPITANTELIEKFIHDMNGAMGVYQYSSKLKELAKFYAVYIEERYPTLYPTLRIPKCDECGAMFPRKVYNNRRYCDSCHSRLFISCSRCGRSVERSRAIDGMCEHCGLRHYITGYHAGAPTIEFFGNNHNNAVPYLGVELEVAYGGKNDAITEHILPIINKDKLFMYCSEDGSIEDGFENITQPATFEHHLSITNEYKEVFNVLRKYDYASHDTSCCGLHVHINRNFFPQDTETECLTKLATMFIKFWDELLVFSRRIHKKMNYCKEITLPAQKYVQRSNLGNKRQYRYYALNLTHKDTVEFRIFRGTLNIDTFMASLELVHNMALFARDKTNEQVECMQFTNLLTSDRLRNYWNRISHTDKEL